MRTIRLKLSDLYALEGHPSPAVPTNLGEITALIVKRFGFLPQPVTVMIEGDEAVVQHPEESDADQQEAKRLVEKAVKRVTEGNYAKAIDIYKRVLELCPSLHLARRDLAMAYVEIDDVDNATNHLIELLRVNPQDVGGWVVLANLYIRQKNDPSTGEKFLRRALEVSPNDPWALNSLAAVTQHQGKTDEAIVLFERSILANPDFANPYYGLAVLFNNTNQPEKALAAINRLFAHAKMQDVRSQPVFDQARKLFLTLQADAAQRVQSEAFKVVQTYKREMEVLSGYPIRVEEADFKDMVGATIQMAWKYDHDYHLIKTRRGYPAELLCHLEMHELTHLRLEAEARKVGKNRFFSHTAKTRETALKSIASDIRKMEKHGYPEAAITDVVIQLIGGLNGFLYNCPLDMLIESYIFEKYPDLRPAQFLSTNKMALEAWETNKNDEVRKITPRKILYASHALNGAFALFLDNLFHGATDYAGLYRRFDAFEMSQRLWKHWQQRRQLLGPGDEYQLVDEFADMLGIRGWYQWQDDPGHHTVVESPPKEGTTNPSLLKAKHPAAVFFFLDAFKRFDAMTVEQVRQVGFEIALIGREGLDYSSADTKYTLKSIPNASFSGLHLMCLMYAAFKRIAPHQDLEIDLNDPFLTALQTYQGNKRT